MPIDAECIARRYAIRPGCRFRGYKAIALPVFSMNLRVLCIESTSIPPIEEFLLRLLQVGIKTPDQLAGLLGLGEDIVHDRLVELRCQELIEVKQGENRQILCSLTEKGIIAAANLSRESIKTVTIPQVLYSGILRHIVDVGTSAKRQFLKPKDAEEEGYDWVQAIPNRYPYPEEISVTELSYSFKKGRKRRNSPELEIMAIKSVLSKVYTLYEPAIMIEYETEGNKDERQFSFIIDGRPAEAYEQALSTVDFQKIIERISSIQTPRLEERLRQQASSEEIQRLGRIDDVEQLAAKELAVQQKLDDKRQETHESDRSDTRIRLQKEIDRLEQELFIIKQERESRSVKYLWTPEIKTTFGDAVKTAKERLLILSGWISSSVVNDKLIAAFRAALERGVRIWIGYGFDGDSPRGREQRTRPDWIAAVRSLDSLQREFPILFKHRDVGHSHEKRLICDNLYTFGGSFNLLSFSGDNNYRNSPLRHEGADLIRDSQFCELLYERYERLFFPE
jgi:hypothetical protein